MSNPTIGSVRPFMMPITGVRTSAGRSLKNALAFAPNDLAALKLANQSTILSEYRSGARDSASTPPASTRLERPTRMLVIGRIQRLHAGRAIAHDRPARHLQSASHAQRDDAADIDFVGRRARAAEDHLVELGWRKRHAHEQRAARLHGEIGRRKRPGLAARLQKRRAHPVDDVDWLIHRSLTSGCRM